MTVDTNQTASQPPKDLIGFLDHYLVQKAPFHLPDAVKEAIVTFGPWVTVVLLVISAPALLVLLGLSAAFLPFAAAGYGYGWFWGIAFCVHLALMVLALPGLFARKMSGWTLMFYAQSVSILASLLAYAVVGAVIVGLISYYILFQVRALYKN